jgi:hypothetical protein
MPRGPDEDGQRDIDSAFANLSASKPAALWAGADSFFNSRRESIFRPHGAERCEATRVERRELGLPAGPCLCRNIDAKAWHRCAGALKSSSIAMEVRRHVAAPQHEGRGEVSGRTMTENDAVALEAVVALTHDDDAVNRTGRTILSLLQRAAGAAEKNTQHAIGIAHKLSRELQASEDHIRKVETELRYYKDRCERAEEWLRQISVQFGERFPASGELQGDPEAAQPIGTPNAEPKKPDPPGA